MGSCYSAHPPVSELSTPLGKDTGSSRVGALAGLAAAAPPLGRFLRRAKTVGALLMRSGTLDQAVLESVRRGQWIWGARRQPRPEVPAIATDARRKVCGCGAGGSGARASIGGADPEMRAPSGCSSISWGTQVGQRGGTMSPVEAQAEGPSSGLLAGTRATLQAHTGPYGS